MSLHTLFGLTLVLWFASQPLLIAADPQPFAIEVVDEATGRGVPLVELQTTGGIQFYTDSSGLVAFDEPGLMNQKVWFNITSHGYEARADGFGLRGQAFEITPGGAGRVSLKRTNIAERLCRLTGAGIYRDTTLLGRKSPVAHPLLNGGVTGCDSVLSATYRNRVYWFWGDTNRPSYPLGNFHTTGATSELPTGKPTGEFGGIDYQYLTGENGFVRGVAHMPGDGPTWLTGLIVLKDAAGNERMLANYSKIKNLLDVYERGFCLWSDERAQFEPAGKIPLKAPVIPFGHPFVARDGDTDYVYFADPLPLIRVRATLDSARDLSQHEAYTCLKPSGAGRYSVERNAQGKPVYKWRADAPPLTPEEQSKRIRSSELTGPEGLVQFRDLQGKRVVAHRGTVHWNEYRQRWIAVFTELGGTSLLGEVWYTEADSLLGPWQFCVKVATHKNYSFYNPRHDAIFDEDNGRRILFEGTYTHTFSGNDVKTPRYDYNQMMYRLDLADERLVLPMPVYGSEQGEAAEFHFHLPARSASQPANEFVAFFACDRGRAGLVPVYNSGRSQLTTETVANPARKPLFFALPPDATDTGTAALWAWTSPDESRRVYRTQPEPPGTGWQKSASPICRVWAGP